MTHLANRANSILEQAERGCDKRVEKLEKLKERRPTKVVPNAY
jgi:hypothetical protein